MTVYTKSFDAKIESAAGLLLPQWHWVWLKAQLYAESGLDPTAVSPVGARGIAQFMPGTWDDAKAALRFPSGVTPFESDYAIKAAAWYMGLLRQKWKSPRAEDDRRRLAQASYNAGFGNILKAQKLAGGASEYQPIIDRLHQVTGEDHAKETRTYVARIDRVYHDMVRI